MTVRCMGVLVSLCCLAPLPAAAQAAPEANGRDDSARELFEQANEAYANARYEDALGYFQSAHALSGRAELLFNVGLCFQQLDRDGEAIEAFEAFLEARPDAPNRRNVEARIRHSRERMAAGAADRQAVEPPVDRPVSEPRGSSVTAIVVTVAGGVVAVAGGVLMGIGATEVSRVEDLEDGSTAWSQVSGDVDRGQTLSLVGGVGIGVGVVVAAVGVVMLLAGGSEPEPAALRWSL